MAWDFRIGRWSASNLIIILCTCLYFLSKCEPVEGFEFDCDSLTEQKAGCNCEELDGSSWEIECPRGLVEVHNITIKVKPLSSISAYLTVGCDAYNFNTEMAWRMLKGLDFEKQESKFNVTGISINKCPLSKNTLQDFFAHAKLRTMSITSFTFFPARNPSNTTFETLFNFISSMHNLEVLDLKSSKLNRVPNLTSLPKLRELLLMDNEISELESTAFEGNPNLKLVELGSNVIKEIPENVFPNTLQRLFLRNNKISKISQRTFSNLKNLEILTLRNNPLSDLAPDAFQELTNLKNLDLYSTEFQEFPNLRNLQKLETLDLSYRDHSQRYNVNLGTTPVPGNSTFAALTLAQTSDQLPTDFDGSVANNSKLEMLTLSNSGLETPFIPSIQGFSNLKILKLDRNRIIEIPKNSFHSSSLTVLDLSWNSIQRFLEILTPNLEELDLSHNKLKNLSVYGFAVLTNLRRLKLNMNLIDHIPRNSFESLTNLKHLDLSHNRLSSLSQLKVLPAPPPGKDEALFNEEFGEQSVLRYCLKMEELILNHNMISDIYEDWKLLMAKLRVLDLSNNEIQRLFVYDINFFSKKLRVDLSSNKLRTITMDHADILLEGFENHELFIKVDNNPLDCSCNVLAFKRFKLRGVTYEYKNLSCEEPLQLKGTQFRDVSDSDLICKLDPSFGCPKICKCWTVPGNKTIVVDCSYRNITDSFPNIHELNHSKSNSNYGILLNLAGNKLSRLNPNSTKNLSSFSNRIIKIDLSQNDLVDLSFLEILISNNETMFYLAENKFSCSDCEFHKAIRSHFKQITDYRNVTCLSQARGGYDENSVRWFVDEIPESEICPKNSLSAELQALVICVGVITVCAVIVVAVYIRHGWALRAFLYSKGVGCCLLEDDSDEDKEKIYDAFVSFSHQDEEWVLSELVDRLEVQEGFKLCLHFRDWTPGDWIPDQIVRSVDKSRRTVVILSKNFVESIWSRLEFKAAHSQAINERGNRLILILVGDDLADSDVQDDDLKVYMKMNTYLKWGDPWFWHKLKYALPHKKSASVQNYYIKQQQRERAIQLDKLRAKMENSVV